MKFTVKGGNGRDKILFGVEFSGLLFALAYLCQEVYGFFSICLPSRLLVFHFIHFRINNITDTGRAMRMRCHGLLENHWDRLFA